MSSEQSLLRPSSGRPIKKEVACAFASREDVARLELKKCAITEQFLVGRLGSSLPTPISICPSGFLLI